MGESGIQGQFLSKNPNKKKFERKVGAPVTQAFSSTATQAEASGSFRPAYNELLSPKQTENYKKLPGGGGIREAGRRYGCQAGARTGDKTEPHSGTPILRLGAPAASSGHLPRGGKGVRVQHRPTRARAAGRAPYYARARGAACGVQKRHYSGTRRAGTNWKTGGGKEPSGPAASGERASPGRRACTLRAGRGRRVSPDEPRGHRKCAGRRGLRVAEIWVRSP